MISIFGALILCILFINEALMFMIHPQGISNLSFTYLIEFWCDAIILHWSHFGIVAKCRVSNWKFFCKGQSTHGIYLKQIKNQCLVLYLNTKAWMHKSLFKNIRIPFKVKNLFLPYESFHPYMCSLPYRSQIKVHSWKFPAVLLRKLDGGFIKTLLFLLMQNSYKLSEWPTCIDRMLIGFVCFKYYKNFLVALLYCYFSLPVTLGRAVEMKHNASLISALAFETSQMFSSAEKALSTQDISLFGSWRFYLKLKTAFYLAFVSLLPCFIKRATWILFFGGSRASITIVS